jgi:hypothetical protein
MEMKAYLPNKSKVKAETYNLRGVPEVPYDRPPDHLFEAPGSPT